MRGFNMDYMEIVASVCLTLIAISIFILMVGVTYSHVACGV